MALSLAICLSAVSAIATKAISDLAVSSCFRELQDSTVQYAADIRTDIEYDLKLLEVIADNMTKQNTLLPGEKKELFTLSKAGILLDEIVLILPDGRTSNSNPVISTLSPGILFTPFLNTILNWAGVGILTPASNSRSEERRVGKECMPQGRSRWSPYH